MRKAGKIVVVIAVILATKVLFNWTDRKWIEECEANGGHYQKGGLGEGCSYDD